MFFLSEFLPFLKRDILAEMVQKPLAPPSMKAPDSSCMIQLIAAECPGSLQYPHKLHQKCLLLLSCYDCQPPQFAYTGPSPARYWAQSTPKSVEAEGTGWCTGLGLTWSFEVAISGIFLCNLWKHLIGHLKPGQANVEHTFSLWTLQARQKVNSH